MATITNKPSYGQDSNNYNNQKRRHSSFGLRAALSTYDEKCGRVPAVTFNNNKPRGRINNNGTNIQPKRNLGNNYGRKNFNANNWRKKFNSAANNNTPPRKIATEKAIVDYVSPGEDGNELLYLFTQGDFVNVKKVEGQPLVIDPNTVIYTGGMKKEGEEEKELWEKLCGESSITVTFDALTWDVLEIISEDALIWARGQSPPCRRRSSWATNPGCGSREQWEQNKPHERKAKKIKGGSPPERRDKAKKPDNQMKRRGSLPSVREFKAAVLSASAPATMTPGITTKPNEDFSSRMEKLEKANMDLQHQLEEAKTKIKVLEDKSTPQDTSIQEEKSIIQDPNKDLLIIEDVKASPVL